LKKTSGAGTAAAHRRRRPFGDQLQWHSPVFLRVFGARVAV
jgi:hypothetical protein